MNRKCVLIILLTAVFIMTLVANDGRDRYAGVYGNELWLFPDSPVYWTGYRVLEKDEPGGADGDQAFRWAQPQAIAVVRVAAHLTREALGDGNHNMPIFDLSAENGDTPVGFGESGVPRGRHPGGSHDGGMNLDLGYYLTSLKGLQYTPDHSACSDHFDRQDKTGGPAKDINICNGFPDRLDVPRQSYFMLQLFKMNRELFHSELLEQIGMDWEIQKAVVSQLAEWVSAGKYGATLELLQDMRRICTADDWEGWSHSHHHHIHLRMHQLTLHGKHRDAFFKLFQLEREIDEQLLAKGNEDGAPLLRVRLRSFQMNRTVQAELLGDIPADANARFRIKGGKWVDADPADRISLRGMIDLPLMPHNYRRKVTVEAELTYPDNRVRRIEDTIVIPRLEPYLFVSVDTGKIDATYKQTGKDWTLKVHAPETYRTYITGVSFEIFRTPESGNSKTTPEASIIDYSYTLKNAATDHSIRMIRAVVVLSSRVKIRVPVYCRMQ